MRFEPGRDSNGRTPLLEDGKPAFAVCGHYYISRAFIGSGYVSDAWYKPTSTELAQQLDGGLSARQALKVCEDHANGVRS